MPIRVNADLRPSRLVKSIPSYVKRSILTIVRIFVIYQPAALLRRPRHRPVRARLPDRAALPLFSSPSAKAIGHIQSLILAGALLTMGFQTFLVAFLADVVSANRRLLEDIRYAQRVARDAEEGVRKRSVRKESERA